MIHISARNLWYYYLYYVLDYIACIHLNLTRTINNIRVTNYHLSTVTVKYVFHNNLLLSYVIISQRKLRLIPKTVFTYENIESSERLFRMHYCHKENRIKHVIENDVCSHKNCTT